MNHKKFNPQKLEKLNNPERYKALPPEFIMGKIGIESSNTIIDIGAGTGFFSIPFAQKYEQSKIYACDISDTMLNWMEQNITDKYPNIIPLKMEESSVPLESNIADIVFMINLHHELKEPEVMLKDCYRLLKDKAKIAISDWKKKRTEHGPSLEIRYKPETVKEQLLAAGFQQVQIFEELESNFLVIAQK